MGEQGLLHFKPVPNPVSPVVISLPVELSIKLITYRHPRGFDLVLAEKSIVPPSKPVVPVISGLPGDLSKLKNGNESFGNESFADLWSFVWSNESLGIESVISNDSELSYCHPIGLVGPLLISFELKDKNFGVMEKEYETRFKNGRFKPTDCIVPARKRVAIIIPFRDDATLVRTNQFQWLLYYMIPILTRQNIEFGFYLINQGADPSAPFNRGKLMNIGFEAGKE